MRIAILADIHGNALALEAVIERMGEDAPDLVVNLGDCVSGPLWPRETCDILMGRDWPTVRGNHDRLVADGDEATLWPSDLFARRELDHAHRDWLRALPLNSRQDDAFLFHARPHDDDHYLLENAAPTGDLALAPRDQIEARLAGARAPLNLCGHSHLPRIVRLSDGGIVVNPGSVGAPGYHDNSPPIEHWVEAGSPHARYALATKRSGDWTVDLRAIEYDWDRAAKRASEVGRPEWARALSTGFIRERT